MQDKMAVYQKLKSHADAARMSGTPDVDVENAIKQYESKSQIQPSSSTPDLNGLVSKALGRRNVGQSFGNALSIIGGGKTDSDDLTKLYQQEAIKKQFEDPLDNVLKNEKINAIRAGLMVDEAGNVIGKAPRPLNEKEQFDFEQTQRANQNQADFIRGNAEDMLKTVAEIRGKDNANMKYFGPLGNVPTIAAPSTLMGEYDERKNWETNVNKLLSGKIVELITDMKQASKTGATGFGQLNLEELRVLQNASTALKRDLSPQDAQRYLTEIENIQKRILGGTPSPSPIGQMPGEVVNEQNMVNDRARQMGGSLTPQQQAARQRLRQKYGV